MTDEEKFAEFVRGWMRGMKNSAFVLSIVGTEVDAHLAMQIGAAILMAKPLLVVVPKGATLPPKLRAVADEILEIPMGPGFESEKLLDNPETVAAMRAAIRRMQSLVPPKQ